MAAITASTLVAASAAADPQSEKAAQAEALFREGRDLLAQRRPAEACPKLAASQRLDPGYGTLYNLADCQVQMGQTASAWASYREAADMARKAGQGEREKKAAQHASDLEPLLERVTIRATRPPPGLVVQRGEVTLDSAMFGVALPVDPGKVTLHVSATGKKSIVLDIVTKGPGQTLEVEIPALEDAPLPTTSPDAAPPVKDGAAQRIAGVVVGGAGVAGIVVGAIFGAFASSRWNDAKTNHCRTDTLCDSTGVSLTNDAKGMATVSTLGFVLGGAAIAGGVVLFATAPRHGSREAWLIVSPALGGLSARGAF